MVTIRHEFFEKATGYRYPVVAHEFSGQNLEEAKAYFRTHLRFDRMLRSVTTSLESGLWGGRWNDITFKSVIRILIK